MKFTLRDYQRDAFIDVRDRIDEALSKWQSMDTTTSFSLTASTGAGKTVIAAAVIESLFYGEATMDYDEDPSVVVLWFSDNPSLNEQSRMRLMEASDRLHPSDLVVVEPPFSQPTFEAGKVYFLNAQRLGKNSLLTRGYVEDDSQFEELRAAPDLQGHTIWETIANTINDPDLTLIMVLDEAHRGFNTKTQRDKPTIVRRLVNGSDNGTQPAVPIVWGISATIDRFRSAMKEADALKTRFALDDAIVDPRRVQESGLVKDTVVLEIPDEAGDFDTVLLRRAAKKLRDSSIAWAKYARDQGSSETVKPLLVLQLPNKPDPDDVGRALDTIFDEYPDLDPGSVRHVLGDHKVETFGGWEVNYIEPERVQETKSVRVLIAKDAISTGWDCPRAEVMVSFRPAKEKTHVHQLLGRLVRNPLARRVPGDEWLNSVECILPKFDRKVAAEVIKLITGKENPDDPEGPKVVLDAQDLLPNPGISESVWECWDSVPSLTIPQRGARPHVRLKALALELSRDGIRPGAVAEATAEATAMLKAAQVRHESALEKALQEVLTVHGQALTGSSRDDKIGYTKFTERADARSINAEYEHAQRAFGPDFTNSLLDILWVDDADDDGTAELDAKARLAGLSTLAQVRDSYDRDVERLSDQWFQEHRVSIKELSDERRSAYEEIRALSTHSNLTPLQRPRTRIGDFKVLDDHDDPVPADVRDLHLMSNAAGEFPITGLNPWEVAVLDAELDRPSIVGWYRNPPRQASDSLGISYRDDVKGDLHSMHPDFIFFNEVGGKVRPSIVDPHGHHLEDALTKLRALATFAEKHGEAFHRIEAITQIGGTMRLLDMQDADIRAAVYAEVKHGGSADDLYESPFGASYIIPKG